MTCTDDATHAHTSRSGTGPHMCTAQHSTARHNHRNTLGTSHFKWRSQKHRKGQARSRSCSRITSGKAFKLSVMHSRSWQSIVLGSKLLFAPMGGAPSTPHTFSSSALNSSHSFSSNSITHAPCCSDLLFSTCDSENFLFPCVVILWKRLSRHSHCRTPQALWLARQNVTYL